MKTVSFGIADYCVPCHAHCRYCLLSSCGKATGAGYERSRAFAERVMNELAEQRAEVHGFYYVGYCMDAPWLKDYIRFSKKYDSPGAHFLQLNGFAFRNDKELTALMTGIKDEGVEMIDLSFYGTEAYHDRFAGRKGDFAFLLRMLTAAEQAGLAVNISIPLLKDNLDQMGELRGILESHKGEKYSYFLPHSKGRGESVQELRITRQEFDSLPEKVRNSFQKTPHKTEAEWISSGEITDPDKRNVNLVLTPDNIARYEGMSAGEILSEMEELDDSVRRQMPTASELARRYGRPDNQQLYKMKDLLLTWQQRYIAETGGTLYDMQDESHSFCVYL